MILGFTDLISQVFSAGKPEGIHFQLCWRQLWDFVGYIYCMIPYLVNNEVDLNGQESSTTNAKCTNIPQNIYIILKFGFKYTYNLATLTFSLTSQSRQHQIRRLKLHILNCNLLHTYVFR